MDGQVVQMSQNSDVPHLELRTGFAWSRVAPAQDPSIATTCEARTHSTTATRMHAASWLSAACRRHKRPAEGDDNDESDDAPEDASFIEGPGPAARATCGSPAKSPGHPAPTVALNADLLLANGEARPMGVGSMVVS